MTRAETRRRREGGALDYRHRVTRRWSGSGVHELPISCRSPRLCSSARDISCMNAAYPICVPAHCRAMGTDTVFVGAEVLSPLPGLAVHGGTEPSAYALGYHLAALRAWGHGFGGCEAAEVYWDRIWFLPLGFRYRSRSRYRRGWRSLAGRVPRPLGAWCSWRTEPSAHALGYHLLAHRAWGHGSGQGWWVGFVCLVSFVES
jgi:hypothetical protein